MADFTNIIFHLLLFISGAVLVALTLFSAVRTFVLPRSSSDPLVKLVFLLIRRLFNIRLHFAHSYSEKDRIMAFYAPVSLMGLLPVWYLLVMIGYAIMYRSLDAFNWYQALRQSVSSVMTLGFEPIDGVVPTLLAFSEAIIGLIMVALLLAYLPTMYSAFSRREAAVSLLEVRAGDPPSPVEMLKRYHRIHGMGRLTEVWRSWEVWFADIEESHTSLAALVFFRSPLSSHSWVTAAGVILDGAALTLSVVDLPSDPQAALCIRAGYLALRRIADFFHFAYNPNPNPGDPISIRREEFDAVCAELEANGVVLKADRERAWCDYAGWRVNYDSPLLALAKVTMAPPAIWSSDREPIRYKN